MVLQSTRLHWVALVVFSGVLALILASCESSYDSDPAAVGDPSGASSASSLTTAARRGRQLFENVGCMGCHTVNGQGGSVGPNLSNEGNAGHSSQWLKTQIRNPKSHDPQTMMPAFDNLSDQQVNDLVDYLESLKQGQARAGAGTTTPAPSVGAASTASVGSASRVSTGGRLWGRTCGECHDLRLPSEYSDAQWAVAVHHMRVRVPLTGHEQQDILAFLQASN